MHTSDLQVRTEGAEYPPWAVTAVRHGVRLACDLLESPVLPATLVLTSAVLTPCAATSARPVADGALDRGADDGADRVDARPLVHHHTATTLHLSYAALISPAYLGAPPYPDLVIRRALRFAAGYAGAQWVMARAAADATWPPWWPEALAAIATTPAIAPVAEGAEGAEGADSYTMATLIATAASDWAMVPAATAGQAPARAVWFFLDRARARLAQHGPAALWRGAFGSALSALTRTVRFSATPGGLSAEGSVCADLATVRALVAWRAGAGPWPFAAPRPAAD